MRWSSTEIRMCCRSLGVGSGSSAIPDDYRRFDPTVNAIYAKYSEIRYCQRRLAQVGNGSFRDGYF